MKRTPQAKSLKIKSTTRASSGPAKTSGKSSGQKSKRGFHPGLDDVILPMQSALIPYFGYCFTKAALRLRKALSDEMEKVGLQLQQMGLMIILAKTGPMNQISLGDEMGIDKATMVKILDSMERAGVVRRGNNSADRRVKLVELTQKGRALMPKMMKTREQVEEKFLSGLSDQEASDLRRLILKLVHSHHQRES